MKYNKVMKWTAKKNECNGIVNCLPLDAKNGIKLTPPQGCEVDKVEVIDGVLTVTFKTKEPQLPKSWDEFCEIFPIKGEECFINYVSIIVKKLTKEARCAAKNRNLLPDYATAEAVLSLCQLIQLRNCYNGDWVPDWFDTSVKYTIEFETNKIITNFSRTFPQILYFKTAELRDEFLRNFRPLIGKLKPLYGIKEGGEQ